MEFLAPFIDIAWNDIKESIKIVWEAIKIIVSVALGLIEGIMTVAMGIIEGDWSRVWEGIKIIAETVWEGIKSIIDTTINIIKGIIDNVMNGIKDIFETIMESIRTVVDDKIKVVKDIFTSISEIDLFDIGKNIIQGLVNGIGSMIDTVNTKVSSIVTGIKDKIAGAFVIKSPSRWMRDFIGGNIMKGLSVGFDKYSSIPGRSAIKVMDDLKDTMASADMGNGLSLVNGLLDALKEGIENNSLSNLIAEYFNEKLMIDVDVGFNKANYSKLGIIESLRNIQLPRINAEAALGLAGGYGLSSIVNNYNTTNRQTTERNRPIIVENVIELDGRAIAKGSAIFMQPELDKINVRKRRMKGIT